MKKVIFILFMLFVVSLVYFLFFTEKERKASSVRKNLPRIHSGMLVSDVEKILNEPDTVYYSSDEKYGAGVQVLQYYQGFGAPDFVRVFIRRDTVIDVIAND